MANYKGHLSGSIVFFIIYMVGLMFYYHAQVVQDTVEPHMLILYVAGLFGLCVMFGLWPDADTNSMGQNIFYTIFFILDLILIWNSQFQEAAYLGLFAILPILGKHRGWTHSWWAMLLIPSPIAFIPYFLFPDRPYFGLPFYGAAVVGYFSHLFMDGMIFPLKKRQKRAYR